MKKNKDQVIAYINSLKDYQGYIQFSNRHIEDIYTEPSDICIDPKDGFVYEAHFCNAVESIAIRQINDTWIVSITPFSEVLDPDNDENEYISKVGKVKMAQIWTIEVDELCEGMQVKKLKNVVFAGFVKGGEK